jgi:zinc transport system permease protein
MNEPAADLGFLAALAQFAFLQRAVAAGLLASVACGVVGTYVVVRRITYIAGAIAHSILGGMGAAVYLNRMWGWSWLDPMHGAVAAAVVSALVIGTVSLRARQREDTVIGAVWAIGMAVGVLFLAATRGYQVDVMGYLFGSISIVSPADVWLIVILDVVILAIVFAFYAAFAAVCFDEEFARARGVRVEAYYLLLLCLTALTIVLLVKIVGIVLVIALLTLPVAIAGSLTHTLGRMMLLATLLCAILTLSGVALSYGADLPAGATTVTLAGGVYLCAVAGRACWPWLTRQRGAPH